MRGLRWLLTTGAAMVLLVAFLSGCGGGVESADVTTAPTDDVDTTTDTSEGESDGDLIEALNDACGEAKDAFDELGDSFGEAIGELQTAIAAGDPEARQQASEDAIAAAEDFLALIDDFLAELEALDGGNLQDAVDAFAEQFEDTRDLIDNLRAAIEEGDEDAIDDALQDIEDVDPEPGAAAAEALGAEECEDEPVDEPTTTTTAPPTGEPSGSGSIDESIDAYCDAIAEYLDDPTNTDLATELSERAQALAENAANFTVEDAERLAECQEEFSSGFG